MKVILTNEALYEFNEGKNVKMSFSTFKNLSGYDENKTVLDSSLPKVRLFKTIGEFQKLPSSEIALLDASKDVYVLQNGQFMIFLKENNVTAANPEENKTK